MGAIVSSLSQPWLGSLFGVIGIVVAVFFYLRSRRLPRLAYQYDEVTLLGGSEAAFPSEVEIRFSGTPVSCVTLSRFVLWNAGKTTLRGSDIVGSDPLRVELGGAGSILKVTVAKTHRDVNAVRVALRESHATAADISFDYLDPGDGVAFEVLHSGGRYDLSVEGTLRGLPEGARSFGRIGPLYRVTRTPQPFRSLRWVLAIILVLGVAGVLAGLLVPAPPANSASSPGGFEQYRLPLVVGGVFYVMLPLFLLWMRRRRYPAALDVWNIWGEG